MVGTQPTTCSTVVAIWFIVVLLPRLLDGQFPTHAMVLTLVFATYVIADLIAIPFGRLFAREA